MNTIDHHEDEAYRRKQAHTDWREALAQRGFPPTDEASGLVWTMMVAYSEAPESLGRMADDIHKTAYELATLLLPDMPMKRIWGLYRDRVVDAVIKSDGNAGGQYVKLLAFANTLSSAYAEAQADLLRKQCLHSRAESISRELRIAKRIQTHLLPKQIPDIPGFQFAGRLIPADEVGGDYWSVKYKPEDDIVTLKLADITGHGVAAATLVAAVKFISGGYYQGAASAAEVMQKTNRVLTIETPHEILVTMVYGWLCPSTRELTLVNAGHSPVFVCAENACTDVPVTGPVLGISETAEYTEIKFRLKENDVVFFGSDGITDAGTIRPFGTERLKTVINENVSRSAEEIADAVVKAVTDYVPRPHDDVSLLVVKVTGDARDSG